MQLQAPDPRADRLTGPMKTQARERRGRRRGSLWVSVLGMVFVLLIGLGGAAVHFGLIPTAPFRDMIGGMLPATQAQSGSVVEQAPAAALAPSAISAAGGSNPAERSVEAAAASAPAILRQEDFGDWHYSCVAAAPGGAPSCSIVQQLAEAESRAVIFAWRIVPDGAGGLAGIWQVPDSVLLTRGLTLEAGTPQPIVIPFETCGAGRCQALANLAPEFVTTLRGAQTLSVSFTIAASRQTLTLPLSPNGLPQALAALAGQ